MSNTLHLKYKFISPLQHPSSPEDGTHPHHRPHLKSRKITVSKGGANQLGQGLVEYLIITVLIGVAALTAVQFVGQSLRYKYAQMANSLGARTPGISAPRIERGTTERKDINSAFE